MAGEPDWQNEGQGFNFPDMPLLDESGHFAQPVDPMLSRLSEAGFSGMHNEATDVNAGDFSIPDPDVLDAMSWEDLAKVTESGSQAAIDAVFESAIRNPHRPMAPFIPTRDESFDFSGSFEFAESFEGTGAGNARVDPSSETAPSHPYLDDNTDWMNSEWMDEGVRLLQEGLEKLARQQNGRRAVMPHVFVNQTSETHALIAEVLKRTASQSDSDESSNRSKRTKTGLSPEISVRANPAIEGGASGLNLGLSSAKGIDLMQPQPVHHQHHPRTTRNIGHGVPADPLDPRGDGRPAQAPQVTPQWLQFLHMEGHSATPASVTRGPNAPSQTTIPQDPHSDMIPAHTQQMTTQQRQFLQMQRQAAMNGSLGQQPIATGQMVHRRTPQNPTAQAGLVGPPVHLAQTNSRTHSNQIVILPNGKYVSMGQVRAGMATQRHAQMMESVGNSMRPVSHINQKNQQMSQQRAPAAQMIPNMPMSMPASMNQRPVVMPDVSSMHMNAASPTRGMAQSGMSHTQTPPPNTASSQQDVTLANMPPTPSTPMNGASLPQKSQHRTGESGNLRGGGHIGPERLRTPETPKTSLIDRYTGQPFTPGARATGRVPKVSRHPMVYNHIPYGSYPAMPMPMPLPLPMPMPMPAPPPRDNFTNGHGQYVPVPMIPTGLTPMMPRFPDTNFPSMPSNMPPWSFQPPPC